MASYQMEGTVKPCPRFSADIDAETLHTAFKGAGTNEAAIIDVLGARADFQRAEIAKVYKQMYGKNLADSLDSELSGNFRSLCKLLILPPADRDATMLYKAMKGAGTDEAALVEVLCTRSNQQILAIRDSYKRLFKTDIEKDISGDTSGYFERLLISLLQGHRDESFSVDTVKAEQDAQKLYKAGEKKLGTDEAQFNAILVQRSHAHLREVFAAYGRIVGKDIEDSIKSEMSGSLEDGMLAVVRFIKDAPGYFAKVLYKSMKGLGTDDDQLQRVVVSRCDVDMVQIKFAFQRDYGKPLGSWISGDTSGDYKKLLLKLIDYRK